ncbi:MAG: transposase [Bacillota bacterium]|nr:transposase [Bacillota bacterium]MDW7677379.1 transposase [Bacillota bacterium]
MAFKPNNTQQIHFDDAFLNLPPRVQHFVQKSWAMGFSEIVFPAINEERFAVLYSDKAASRPNAPVNAVIGSLMLKKMFGLTEEDLLESILCDVRFQVALRTTSFK